ncbi:hypothetical protein [Baekduia sp.]|uniref:hypothetical protein n=1 Tax=Baekduia sp. TaxID=2600305 RepID=UPI002E163D76
MAIIVGLRVLPHRGGWIAVTFGGAGIAVWLAFLCWFPSRSQPREVVLGEVEPIDGEVTAYVASLLLPLVAVGNPDAGDLGAYVVCAVLILIVGYAADLGSVNPVIYLLGLRVVRAEVDGRLAIMLVRLVPSRGDPVVLVRAAGVIRVLDDESENGSKNATKSG